jgi:hypothetical protein
MFIISLTPLFIGHIIHLTPPNHPSHYKTLVSSRSVSLQLTSEDGADKEIRNVVVSQPKPHNVGKPKNQET